MLLRESKTAVGQTIRFMEVTSDELREATYRLRYRIYVEECGFERPEDHVDGMERDAYDAGALHFAALDQDDAVIGTIRVITHSAKGFPTEKATQTHFIGPKPAGRRIAEVSRLAVLPAYRRQRGPEAYQGEFSFYQRSSGNNAPCLLRYRHAIQRSAVSLSLIGLAYEMSKRLEATHLYMITEKSLWRMLKHYGLLFHPIGDPVEYHGLRIPYLSILEELDAYLFRRNPTLLRHPAFRRGWTCPHPTSRRPRQPVDLDVFSSMPMSLAG